MRILAWLLLAFCSLAACSIGVSDKQWELADSFVQQKQYLRAIEEYSRIVNLEQNSDIAVKAQAQIANIYEVYLKDYPRAIRSYRDMFRRTEDPALKTKARWAVAKIYADRLGDFYAAVDEYEILYKDHAKNSVEGPQVLLEYAKALMESGRYSDAAARLVEFRNTYPGHSEGLRAILLEAQAYLSNREEDRALEVFREIIRRYRGVPEHASLVAEAYYGVGLCFEEKDDYQKALEAFRESLRTYPNPKVIELKIERLERRQKERKF